jgi:hypothetical protein
MGAVNLIIIVESARALISQEDNNEFHIASIAAVAAALGELYMAHAYPGSHGLASRREVRSVPVLLHLEG